GSSLKTAPLSSSGRSSPSSRRNAVPASGAVESAIGWGPLCGASKSVKSPSSPASLSGTIATSRDIAEAGGDEAPAGAGDRRRAGVDAARVGDTEGRAVFAPHGEGGGPLAARCRVAR